MVAPIGPIVSSLTLAAGGCGWDTRHGNPPLPAGDGQVAVSDDDIRAAIFNLQYAQLPVGKCTYHEINFTPAKDNAKEVHAAALVRQAFAEVILLKFTEYKQLPEKLKPLVAQQVADLLAKNESGSLYDLMSYWQQWHYNDYCQTHHHLWGFIARGSFPESLLLKTKISEIKAIIENATKPPLAVQPGSGEQGETLTVVLSSSRKLPAAPANLSIDFGAGITSTKPEMLGNNRFKVKISIANGAALGERAIKLKSDATELDHGSFTIIAKPVVEKPAPAPEPKPEIKEEKEAPVDRPTRSKKPAPFKLPGDIGKL
jgi:hypothetical protein